MILIGIDVGHINMGITRCVLDDENKPTFTHAFKKNIAHVIHHRIEPMECKIPHTNETCDRVAHFIQEYRPMFGEADKILIERQPPMGLKDIEALLMSAFRDKTILISPNSMHKHFGISHYDYEQRKEKTVGVATDHIGHIYDFQAVERKHDIADAVCLVLFYIKTKIPRIIKRLPLDEYRYKPPSIIP